MLGLGLKRVGGIFVPGNGKTLTIFDQYEKRTVVYKSLFI